MERLSLRDAGGQGGGAATATAPIPTHPHHGGAAVATSSAPLTVGAGGRPTQPIALLPPAAVRHVREAFGELLATSPSSLILSLGQGSVSRSAGGGASLAQAAAAAEDDPRGGVGGVGGVGGGTATTGAGGFNPVQYEAAMWDAFAQVYSAEVEARIQHQQQEQQRDTTPPAAPTNPAAPAAPLPVAAASGGGAGAPRDAQLSVEDRRQVLADILVWAEVTRPGYDAAAADFVTGPHASDVAFRRVGEALKRAKEERGLA